MRVIFFQIQESLPPETKDLSNGQKQILPKIADILKSRSEWTSQDLEQAIYELAKAELSPKETFQAAYLSLLGKPKGPRLASFILSLDQKFVIKRFEEVNQ